MTIFFTKIPFFLRGIFCNSLFEAVVQYALQGRGKIKERAGKSRAAWGKN
jgi:hypothetical protein